ncbi:MAG TPA: SRPBCC family protein [Solirubrobacteraceae bacterium]|nr:SRPBCC family protein [Solirubrobacteraceae bacterium]
MRTVVARQQLPGASVDEAQRLWFDLARRPSFVDGFGALARSEGDWPHAGARIVWDSLPGGRGRVVEHVLEYEPGVAQIVRVEDPALTGTQRVRLQAVDGGCAIVLELAYELKRHAGGATALRDVLFVRRALGESLRRTLRRFAIELRAERELLAEIGRPRPLPRNHKES